MELKDIPTIVMLLVLSGMLMGAGLIAFSQFKKTMTTDVTKTNESINFAANNTYYAFAEPGLYTTTVSNAANTTINVLAGNFSWDRTHVKAIFDGAAGMKETGTYLVTYSHDVGTTQYFTITNVSQGIGNISEQLPTAGTLIGVSIIVFITLGIFYLTLGRSQR